MANDKAVYDLYPASPAALKNRAIICKTLQQIFSTKLDQNNKPAMVLEVGSGSGAHTIFLAHHMPHITFQPTEREAEQLSPIAEWVEKAQLKNIRPPLKFDLLDKDWPDENWPHTNVDVIISINVIHIAPWAATLALIEKATNLLATGGLLYFYGPFFRSDVISTPSNIAFDEKLRASAPEKGIRNLGDITTHAKEAGFKGPEIVEMPSNNLSVIFTKA